MKDLFVRYKYPLAVILVLVILVICLLPFLRFPYYWDEAWVYGRGVRIMSMNGPGLLPTALPVDISRGHPLLFYFLGGIWLKIFGNTIYASHLFSLFVTLILIYAVYRLCADFLSKRLAFFIITLLVLQPVFLGQSCLVLPEMMLAMWTILCLWAFYSGKKMLYVLFGAFLILTKETGIVCIIAIGINEIFFDLFQEPGTGTRSRWTRLITNYKKYFYIALPVLIASVHFILQKIIYGWFLFPEHLGYISFKWPDLSHKFQKYFSYLFIFDGRNAFFFGGLIALLILLIRKARPGQDPAAGRRIRILTCLALFIFLYLFFSSVNFYSNRYILSAVPPLIILCVYLVDTAMKNAVLRWTAFTAFVITGIYYALNVRTNADHNPGYASCVKLYKESVDYCVKENFSRKKIYTDFLVKNALTDTLSGYLDGKQAFKNTDSNFDPSVELCIFSSIEQNPYSDSIKKNVPMKLIRSFKNQKADIEIFEVVKPRN